MTQYIVTNKKTEMKVMKKKRVIIIITAVFIFAAAAGTGGYLYARQYIPEIAFDGFADLDTASWTMDHDGEVVINGSGELPDLYRNYSLNDTVYREKLDLIEKWAYRINPGFHAKRITIGKDVRDFNEERKLYNGEYFWMCEDVAEIEVADENPFFSSEDGVLFNKDKTTLLRYPPKKPDFSYAVPESVAEINAYAFSDCHNLKELSLPEGLEKVGDPETISGICFAGLNSLEKITADPANQTYTVRDGVLFDKEAKTLLFCPPKLGIAEYVLPQSAEAIAAYAFAGCEYIETVILGDHLSAMGEWSFSQCSALKSVSVPGSLKAIPEGAFWGCAALESVEIRDGIKHIGAHAFYGCEKLMSVSVPDSVTGIGYAAFGYFFRDGRTADQKVKGFSIVCSDSCAAAKLYAEKNGFTLKTLIKEE